MLTLTSFPGARKRIGAPERVPRRRGNRREHRVGRACAAAVAGSSRIVTSIGGVSDARSTPNDRIVRSCTSPVSGSTASDSDVTQPSAMCAAPIAYDRSTTSSRGSPAATWTSTATTLPPSTRTRARARAPLGVTTSTSRPSAPGDEDRLLGEPGGAQIVARPAGPRTIDLVPPRAHVDAVGHRPGARDPAPAATRRRSRRVAARDCHRRDRRALRAESHDVLARVHDAYASAEPVRELARSERRRRVAPCRRTRRRSRAASPVRHRARTTTRRARGTRARPMTSRVARHRVGTAGMRSRSGGADATVVRRPCTLPAAARGFEQRLGDDPLHARPPRPQPAVEPGGNGTATSASRGAVSSANDAPAQRHVVVDALRRTALERRSLRRPFEITLGARATLSRERLATVSQPVHRHRCAARRAVRVADTCAREPHDDPRRAEPALRTAASRRTIVRPAHDVGGIEPLDRRDHPPVDARQRASRTRREGSPSTSTVQQPHCPCGAHPSFAERIPRRSRKA